MEGKSQPFRKRAGLTPFFLRPPHLLPVKCPKLCVHGHDLIREGTLRQGGSGQPHFDPLLPTIHATGLHDLCFFPQRTWSSEHLQQSQPGQGELHQVSLWGGSKTPGGSGGRVCLQCGRPGFNPWVELFHVSVARNREDKLIPHIYIYKYTYLPRASLVVQSVENPPAMEETQVQSLGGEDPLEKEWQPTPVFLPGKFHGQRSLAGYSPWGCKGSDITEQLTLTHSPGTREARQPQDHQSNVASLGFLSSGSHCPLFMKWGI